MPLNSSGIRNVAWSLTTAMSLHMAIIKPPPWHSPLTADTTGLPEVRKVSNGSTESIDIDPKSIHWSAPPPPRSPPGANTSAVPVMMSPARSGSELTRFTA